MDNNVVVVRDLAPCPPTEGENAVHIDSSAMDTKATMDVFSVMVMKCLVLDEITRSLFRVAFDRPNTPKDMHATTTTEDGRPH